MDNTRIKRIETIVEEIEYSPRSFPEEYIEELNCLTGNSWTKEEYLEYCQEFYSRSTLEETVYALLHDGNYPDNRETDVYCLKTLGDIGLAASEVIRKLRKSFVSGEDEEFFGQFPDLPAEEIYQWLYARLENWDEKPEDISHKFAEKKRDSVWFQTDIPGEYARYKSLRFALYDRKLLFITYQNLDDEEKRDIFDYIKGQGLNIYEDVQF